MRNVAVVALVPVAQVKVAQERVVKKALKDDVLVAGGASVVNATQAVCTARGYGRVGRVVCREVLNRIGEQFIVLPLTAC